MVDPDQGLIPKKRLLGVTNASLEESGIHPGIWSPTSVSVQHPKLTLILPFNTLILTSARSYLYCSASEPSQLSTTPPIRLYVLPDLWHERKSKSTIRSWQNIPHVVPLVRSLTAHYGGVDQRTGDETHELASFEPAKQAIYNGRKTYKCSIEAASGFKAYRPPSISSDHSRTRIVKRTLSFDGAHDISGSYQSNPYIVNSAFFPDGQAYKH